MDGEDSSRDQKNVNDSYADE